jgi:anti-anti-sigma factor
MRRAIPPPPGVGQRLLTPGSQQQTRALLSQATFVDSTTLEVLLEAWRSRSEAGLEVVIRAPSPVVLRTLEVAGLVDVLPLELAERPRR